MEHMTLEEFEEAEKDQSETPKTAKITEEKDNFSEKIVKQTL